jgi:hypothetical protein
MPCRHLALLGDLSIDSGFSDSTYLYLYLSTKNVDFQSSLASAELGRTCHDGKQMWLLPQSNYRGVTPIASTQFPLFLSQEQSQLLCQMSSPFEE